MEAIFAEEFGHWGLFVDSEAVSTRTRGVVHREGWFIEYFFGEDINGSFLEYYARHRMTNDRHVRIYESGYVKGLDAFWDMIFYPSGASQEYIDEAEAKWQEHNKRVRADLESLGFFKGS